MTPRQKAIAIYDKFWDLSPYSISVKIPDFDGKDIEINHNQGKHAKDCALILVDEMILNEPTSLYLDEVKIELNYLN